MKLKMVRGFSVIMMTMFISIVWAVPVLAQSGTPDAKIEISQWKVGFIVGVGGGGGTLAYKGKTHQLSIKGLRVGATAGIATTGLVVMFTILKLSKTSKAPIPRPRPQLLLAAVQKYGHWKTKMA